MSKPLVYISGPYTFPDPAENTHRAIRAATELLDSGLVIPVVPHLTMFWHTITPRPYETWLELDLEMVARCDAVLRLPGESPGADRECAHAEALGILVFDDVRIVLEWFGGGV